MDNSAEEKLASAIACCCPDTASLKHFARKKDSQSTLWSMYHALNRANDSFLNNKSISGIEALVKYFSERLYDGITKEQDGKFISEPEIPTDLNFDQWLESRRVLLDLNISLRGWVERINSLLDKHDIDLPRVSNSMLTRLRKEAADTDHKRSVIRSVAFWIGHERPRIASKWNYHRLIQICSHNAGVEVCHEGVRIAFGLSSRGDLIDHQALLWLKKTSRFHLNSIQTEIPNHPLRLRTNDITTFFVDVPAIEMGGKANYRNCLRQAISIAHQLSMSWTLCEFSSKRLSLSIGILCGSFSTLDTLLAPMLNAKLTSDPIIRISEKTKRKLLLNDIRIIHDDNFIETKLNNGETFTIWALTSLWSFIYFDFIDDLQNDPALGYRENNLPGDIWRHTNSPALERFMAEPDRAMLGIEIAKSLYFRKRFHDAIEVINMTLSINPKDLVARTLRLMIHRNIGIESNHWEEISASFQLAMCESEIIEKQPGILPEDYYCEIGITWLAMAIKVISLSRQGDTVESIGRNDIFSWLQKSQHYFELGVSVSPSGIRATFLLTSTKLVKAIFQQDDEDLWVSSSRQVDAPLSVTRAPIRQLLRLKGYPVPPADIPIPIELHEKLEKRLDERIEFYNDAIELRAYLPTVLFTAAVSHWDFTLRRTKKHAKNALRNLRSARAAAISLKGEAVGIYSFASVYGSVVDADTFCDQMTNSILMIEKLLPTLPETNVYEAENESLPANLLISSNFP